MAAQPGTGGGRGYTPWQSTTHRMGQPTLKDDSEYHHVKIEFAGRSLFKEDEVNVCLFRTDCFDTRLERLMLMIYGDCIGSPCSFNCIV
ncbi:hypothetical protein TWF718_010413 [Orbilia javanica]|uniref:Uncharacterized protein n=1 Tax=Orbilia javanica TaxID=47235 RepID=A0AAN8MJM4_9PEZI